MTKNVNLLGAVSTVGLFTALLSACAGPSTVATPGDKSATVHESPKQKLDKPTAASDMRSLSGKVVETMNVGSYTYLNVEKDGQKFWAAVPLTTITVGQNVELRPGMIMGKFTSNQLKRTFDDIVFSAGLKENSDSSTPSPESKPFLPPGHPAMDSKSQVVEGAAMPVAKELPKGHTGMVVQPANEAGGLSGKVVETMDSGGYTYVLLDNGGKKVWAAIPTSNVTVGQELTLQPGQEMTNFKSKSLNRTFDSVIFSGGVVQPAAK